MKRSILLISALLFNFNLFCQDINDINSRINCVIFIDAKIPANVINGYFEYIDTLSQRQTIDFYYITGDIICKKKDLSVFKLSPPLNDKVTMYLNYRDFIKDINNPIDRQYKIALDYNLMFSTIVLMIVNVDKEKGIYVYDIDIGHQVGRSINNQGALKKSRQLRESYLIRDLEEKRDQNIFEKIWHSIGNMW